jgi:hypothetical protein
LAPLERGGNAMKKTLTMSKTDKEYEITNEKGEMLLAIDFSTKKISGSDIYNKIYIDVKEGETSAITLLSGANMTKEDDVIFKQMTDLFKDIDDAVLKLSKPVSENVDLLEKVEKK